MLPYFDCLKKLTFHRMNIRITCLKDIQISGWIGAMLRNNFLYAAEFIHVEEENISLRELISMFPLTKSHFLCKELENGFPAPFVLSMHSHINLSGPVTFISRGEIVFFSMILIGHFAEYFKYFLLAVEKMCRLGMGNPQSRFLLVDITEQSLEGEDNLLMTGENIVNKTLLYPVSLQDFILNKADKEKQIKIIYKTPVSLFKLNPGKKSIASYQDKQNGFPSFYQLIRSLSYRLLKLFALYQFPEDHAIVKSIQESLEEYIEKAVIPVLCRSDIEFITIKSTPRKDRNDRILFSGYVGELVFSGNYNYYLPLLRFMQDLGVGDNVVYGMGRYEVEIY